MADYNLIELKKCTKNYDKFTLNIESLYLRKGEVTGLIGKNGAGKTTLLNCLMNLVDYDCDSYIFMNQAIDNENYKYRENIGFVADSFEAYENTKIREIAKFYKKFYPSQWSEDQFNELINMLDLSLDKKVKELSRGMKVKFQIALVLARSPLFLLLDEPTAGLDPIVREEILELLKANSRTRGTTILFSSHITEDIDKIADNVIFIDDGKLLMNESLQNIKSKFFKTEVKMDWFKKNQDVYQYNAVYIFDEEKLNSNELNEISKYQQCTLNEILIYLRRRKYD